MGLFGKQEKKNFDIAGFLKAQEEMGNSSEMVERKLLRPSFIPHTSNLEKGLTVAGNFAGGAHPGNVRIGGAGMKMMGGMVAGSLGRQLAPGAQSVKFSSRINTAQRQKSQNGEITGDELIVTNARMIITQDESNVLWGAFLGKEYVKNSRKGQAKRNFEIAQSVWPKKDKGEFYGAKLAGETYINFGHVVTNIGYIAVTDLIIGVETKTSMLGERLGGNYLVVEVARISSPIKINMKAKSTFSREATLSFTNELRDKSEKHSYELRVKDETLKAKEEYEAFAQKLGPKVAELKSYALQEKGKELFVSEEFKADWNSLA